MKEVVKVLALERLYEEYKLDVYRYLIGLTHDKDIADDLLSECFLVAIRKLPFFRGDSTVKTWLFGIARNCWLQHLKRQRHEVSLDDMVEVYITDDALGQVVNKQLCERVMLLIEQYDERTRRIVEMRINGYSYREIATELRISEGSARVMEHRVRKHLREQLIKEGYEIVTE